MPDRTELTEISTAVMQGTDCFILSHETSESKFGPEALTFLAKAIAEAESVYDHEQMYVNVREEIKRQGARANNLDVLTTTATAMAFEPENDVDMIICLTESGKIAR